MTETQQPVVRVSAVLARQRAECEDRGWVITPAMADLIGVTRDMVDAHGHYILPNGNQIRVPAWAEEDGA